MKLKTMRLPMAVAFASFAFLTVPASAAMPVNGVLTSTNSAIIQIAQKKKKMTRKQEVDKSVETGTVPARYRGSIPKEYHQYIPFAKQ